MCIVLWVTMIIVQFLILNDITQSIFVFNKTQWKHLYTELRIRLCILLQNEKHYAHYRYADTCV